MPDQDESQDQLEVSIRRNFGNDITVSRNLQQRVILTTADKALLRAKEFEEAIKSKHDLDFPAGVLLGIVTMYVTAEFHDALWLSKETWSALFLLVALACVVFIIKSLYRRFVTHRVMSAEQFVEQLMGSKDLNGSIGQTPQDSHQSNKNN